MASTPLPPIADQAPVRSPERPTKRSEHDEKFVVPGLEAADSARNKPEEHKSSGSDDSAAAATAAPPAQQAARASKSGKAQDGDKAGDSKTSSRDASATGDTEADAKAGKKTGTKTASKADPKGDSKPGPKTGAQADASPSGQTAKTPQQNTGQTAGQTVGQTAGQTAEQAAGAAGQNTAEATGSASKKAKEDGSKKDDQKAKTASSGATPPGAHTDQASQTPSPAAQAQAAVVQTADTSRRDGAKAKDAGTESVKSPSAADQAAAAAAQSGAAKAAAAKAAAARGKGKNAGQPGGIDLSKDAQAKDLHPTNKDTSQSDPGKAWGADATGSAKDAKSGGKDAGKTTADGKSGQASAQTAKTGDNQLAAQAAAGTSQTGNAPPVHHSQGADAASSAQGFQAQMRAAQNAPAQAAAYTSRGATTSQPAAQQVAVQISRAVGLNDNRMTVHLKPADLGKVTVQLEVKPDNRLTAVISADHAHTLQLLQRDAHHLARALNDSGLKADSGSLQFNLQGDGGNNAAYDQGSGSTPRNYAISLPGQVVSSDYDLPVVRAPMLVPDGRVNIQV